MAPFRQITDLRPGEHVCCLYETEEERQAVIVPFLRRGLEQGDKVIYIADPPAAEVVVGWLRAAGLAVEPSLASEQLSVLGACDTYAPAGTFDPDEMIARLRAAVDAALAEGYPAVRVSGEMGWALQGLPGSERLIEYELKASALLPGSRCLAICQYDRLRFPATVLSGLLAIHGSIAVGTLLYDNPYHVPLLGMPEHDLGAIALNYGLDNLAAHRRAQEAMEHRLAVEEALAQVCSLLAAEEGADVTEALAVLGRAVGASRAYIFRFRDGGRWMDNTHEWCAPGVEPQMQNLQGIESASVSWWMGLLRRNENIAISDVSALPAEAATERRILEAQSIRAVVVVPMFSSGQLLGFLGFDDTERERQWLAEDMRLLRLASEALVVHGERQRAVESLRFLAEASRVLSTSLDCEATLRSAAHLAVPALADWCVVDVAEEDGSIRRVAAAHADPAKEPLLQALQRSCPAGGQRLHPIHRVIGSGEAEVLAEISEADWVGPAPDAERLGLLGELGFRSGMVVPLATRGRTLGAITFAAAEPGCYGAAELAMAEELARRCALAADNALLFRQAQKAIHTRDRFLSAAAHELKTPITSIRGFAQLTLRRFEMRGAVEPEEMRQALQVIDQQSNRLARLVSQLLDSSRLQGGHLALARQLTDIAALAREVVAAAQAKGCRQTLVLRALAAAPALVDPLRLEQVLHNLIDNAIRYSGEGQSIEVDVSTPSPETVHVAVRDHGIGIPPEHQRRIFERHYGAHLDNGFGGLGVGLYVSRGIIDLHGGRIEIETPPDGGARFIVSLPSGLGKDCRSEGGGSA